MTLFATQFNARASGYEILRTNQIVITIKAVNLAILTEFIKMNGGNFQIISDDAFFQIGNAEKFGFLEYSFP